MTTIHWIALIAGVSLLAAVVQWQLAEDCADAARVRAESAEADVAMLREQLRCAEETIAYQDELLRRASNRVQWDAIHEAHEYNYYHEN